MSSGSLPKSSLSREAVEAELDRQILAGFSEQSLVVRSCQACRGEFCF